MAYLEQGRITYFDVTKGILILFVLVQHYSSAMRMLQLCTDFDTFYTIWHPAFLMFIMPCFFLISGYCSDFSCSCKTFFLKIVKRLVVPYVVFQLVNCFLFMVVVMQDFSFTSFFSLVSHSPYTSLWFLIALTFSKIVVCCLKKLFGTNMAIVITLVLLILGVVANQYEIFDNILCFKNSLISCFFVAVGIFLRENMKCYEKALYYGTCLYVPLMLVLIGLHLPKPSLTAFIDVNLKTVPLFIVMSLSGSLSILYFSRFIEKNKVLSFWGRNSLVVYGLHFIPLFCLIRYFFQMLRPTTLPVFVFMLLVVYICELLLCKVLIRLINTENMRWIIGK